MKNRNIGKGIVCLLVAAVIIMASSEWLNFAIFTGLSTGRLVASIIIGVILIGAIIDKDFDAVIIFGGVLLKLLEKQLGLHIKIPVLIAVIILLLMARSFIFPKKKSSRLDIMDDGNGVHLITDGNASGNRVSASEADGSYIYEKNRFNGIVKYITSDNFKKAQIDSQFGGVELYFNNAMVPDGHAEVELDTKFSGVDIYVPRHWTVVNNLHNKMGDVSIDEMIDDAEGMPVELVLSGYTEFGGVKVNRI